MGEGKKGGEGVMMVGRGEVMEGKVPKKEGGGEERGGREGKVERGDRK